MQFFLKKYNSLARKSRVYAGGRKRAILQHRGPATCANGKLDFKRLDNGYGDLSTGRPSGTIASGGASSMAASEDWRPLSWTKSGAAYQRVLEVL